MRALLQPSNNCDHGQIRLCNLINILIIFNRLACKCPEEDLKTIQVKPGDTKVDVKWQVPVPGCLGCQSPLTSQSLSVGQHSMRYKYNVADQFNVTCRVNIEVKGEKLRN